MNQHEQQVAARSFIERWRGRGDEKQDTQAFWTDLLVNVLGVPSTQIPSFVSFERKVRGGYIDVFMEDAGVLVEQKGLAVDLDKPAQQSDGAILTPFEQAVRYKARLADPIKPRWVVTSNFKTIRVYDQHEDATERHPQVIELEDLADEYWRLGFITDKSNSRIERERRLSVEAGEIVAKLYGRLSALYHNLDTSPREQESLNVLVVRLVFLLFAEDAGLLQKHDAFRDYLTPIPADQLRQALIDLFKVLDTPDNERDPYLPESLLAFPYVNGGVFADETIVIPRLDDNVKLGIFEAADFDWRLISPTIFGAVFESTLNPETRRHGGMHYTSVENIHKVIDPLFLDDLRRELEDIEALKTERARIGRLRAFQRKLGSITVLDPACGSGNFLTESYLSLRRLENRALSGILGDQMGLCLEGELDPIHVTIDQFYGIEINDFAVAVARTALWIAEFQMKSEAQEILWQYGDQLIDELPLTSNPHIVLGNALRMDWNDVVPAEQCTYICGNPPFVGSSLRSQDQTEDMRIAYGNFKHWGKCDYGVGWFKKSADYIAGASARCALVATNSISQGEQVRPTWEPLFKQGIVIDFAWRTFVWNNEALDMAHVHCIIVGFSYAPSITKVLFSEDGSATICKNINGYLTDAPNVFLPSRTSAKDGKHLPIIQGSKPVGGGLIFSKEEHDEFIARYPELEDLFRPYYGASEFVKGEPRYCLWLKGMDIEPLRLNPILRERFQLVHETRAGSPTDEFREFADREWLFVQDRQPETDYLLIPSHTSARRDYIPIGFVPQTVVSSNATFLIPGATLYDFGLVTSRMHNAWMRTVAGRIKSDYRYSPVVYNTFTYPEESTELRAAIELSASNVLDARVAHGDMSLAELYDPDTMPRDLRSAHLDLDSAVAASYGVSPDADEATIVGLLFSLYSASLRKGRHLNR